MNYCMENNKNKLIRGDWKKGKTILLAEYITTEDLDYHKYIIYSNSDLVEYMYSVEDEKIHILESVNQVLVDSRKHTDIIVVVMDDITTELGSKHNLEIIEELQLVLKDRLKLVCTTSIIENNRKETEPSILRADELISKFNFTDVTDIDSNWVHEPESPAYMFKYRTNLIKHTTDINALAGKWFKIREENKKKFKQRNFGI